MGRIKIYKVPYAAQMVSYWKRQGKSMDWIIREHPEYYTNNFLENFIKKQNLEKELKVNPNE